MASAGIVLCGGLSSRMGRAKAWLPWRGRPMLAHVVDVLGRAVDEVVVVSSAKLDPPPVDVPVVRDREPERGPLAGIREGLAHVEAELAYVTGTDAPFLDPSFVKTLLGFGGAAAPEVDGHVQTLAAVYPRSALACAESLLEAGRLRPLFLLEATGYRRVGAYELPETDSLRGFNTPQEYLRAVTEVEPDARAVLELLGRARLLAGRREIPVPVGTLGQVLAHAPGVELLDRNRVARPYLVSIEGRHFVRNAAVPIGSGERVIVLDSSVGG